jgi:hypothetical protein
MSQTVRLVLPRYGSRFGVLRHEKEHGRSAPHRFHYDPHGTKKLTVMTDTSKVDASFPAQSRRRVK